LNAAIAIPSPHCSGDDPSVDEKNDPTALSSENPGYGVTGSPYAVHGLYCGT